MAQKYKLKEAKIGDTKISGGVKYTVSDIDPETGSISWKVENVPAFDSTFKEFDELRKFITKLSRDTKDEVIDNIANDIKKSFNNYRTHIRKNYPEQYKKAKMNEADIDEVSTSGGAGAYNTPYAFKLVKKQKEIVPEGDGLLLVHVYDKDGKMYGTGSVEKVEGDKTTVRFDGSTVKRFPSNRVKLVKEDIGATLGPGPKAGPEGVKDNEYVKQFKYKLVPKTKKGTYVQKGSGLDVKKLF